MTRITARSKSLCRIMSPSQACHHHAWSCIMHTIRARGHNLQCTASGQDVRQATHLRDQDEQSKREMAPHATFGAHLSCLFVQDLTWNIAATTYPCCYQYNMYVSAD